MLKKLLSHSAIYGLAPQIGKIAGIFALPIITKDLTEADFGVWGIVIAYFGALQVLSNLGMGVVLSNAFFKMPMQYKWLWRQVYGFLMLWSIPYAILIGIILWWIMPTEALGQGVTLILLLVLPKAIFGPTTTLGTFYYQLNQHPTPIAIRTGILGLLTIFLNVYTISYLKMGFMGWAWTSFIIAMLMNISYWIPINLKLGYTPIFNFKKKRILESFNVGLPTVPHQYSAFLLNSSDRIVMDQMDININQLGEYNLAYQFGNYFQTMVGAANKAISPMLLQCYKNKNDLEARNLVFVLQIIVLCATFFFQFGQKKFLNC